MVKSVTIVCMVISVTIVRERLKYSKQQKVLLAFCKFNNFSLRLHWPRVKKIRYISKVGIYFGFFRYTWYEL